MNRCKSDNFGIRASVAERTESAVFSAICSNAKDADACQAYVERLEEASLNIERFDDLLD